MGVKLILFCTWLIAVAACQNVNQIDNKKSMISQKEPIESLNDYLFDVMKLDIKTVMTKDFSQSFPWMGNPDLFCVFENYNGDSHVLLRDGEDDWIKLNSSANRPYLFDLMKPAITSCEFNSPRELRKLIKAIFQLSEDPRNEILDDVFLQRNERVIFTYLKKDGKSEQDFKNFCTPIGLRQEGIFKYLDFRTIDRKGAIQQWNVVMKETIQSIEISELEKGGSFVYPNEY